MIPFLDLKAATDELREELDVAYHRFMDSGWYVLGEEVERFEREYGNYCEADQCVGVATGLDALEIALRALNLSPDDEVIVPSNTYIATWLAVTRAGARIVPVEPCPETHNMTAAAAAAAVTPATRVIMPVNLYGQPVDYDGFMSLAESANLRIVVDNAQAHGALYKGRRVGGIAHIECHSFYPTKNLGAFGEAGAVTTHDESIAEWVRMYRNYGSQRRYYNEFRGTNSRIDALQAAFLGARLRHLDAWNDRRRAIAAIYFERLAGLPGITLPHVPEWTSPVWHLFVIRCSRRAELRARLDELQIGSLIHYPIPPHKSGAYQSSRLKDDYPVASALADTVLSLPMGPHLPADDAVRVAEAIAGFAASGNV